MLNLNDQDFYFIDDDSYNTHTTNDKNHTFEFVRTFKYNRSIYIEIEIGCVYTRAPQ